MIKEDMEDNKSSSKLILPLFLILDDLLNSLGACGVQNTNTYFLTADTKDVRYKLTIVFDPKYTNIFAKQDIINAIESINLESTRKTEVSKK